MNAIMIFGYLEGSFQSTFRLNYGCKIECLHFCYENMARKMPYFHGENPIEFRIWCVMAHQQGFMPVYTACANVLMLGQAEAPQSIQTH